MSAKDTLKMLTASDASPALEDTEIDELLAGAGIADGDELLPTEPGWTPTYDLNMAAAAGWLIKASRALGVAETDPASDVFEHCMQMSRHFRSKMRGSVRILFAEQ